MTTDALNADLNALASACYSLRQALGQGDYRKAVLAAQTAHALATAVAGDVAEISRGIGERDLSDELQRSIDAVKGKDDAA